MGRAGSVPFVDRDRCFGVFDDVVVAVRSAIASVADRGSAGDRASQYRIDVVADGAAGELLSAAGVGVLSEESAPVAPESGVVVVIDPIDGSTNAARGIPFSACAMCAVDSDGPWLAQVTHLEADRTYRAVRGQGATRDGASIAVASPAAGDEAVVAVNGGGHRPAAGQTRALGALSLEMCLVADGSLDGVINLDGDCHGVWDYLAAALIVTEAGGVVADRHGRRLDVLDRSARRDLLVASDAALLDWCRGA